MAYKYESNGLKPSHQAKRIFFLYLHYWIVLSAFLFIGHFLVPDSYPGSLNKFIKNIFGWSYTYNAEMWFLLPYSLVSLTSFIIIKVIDKIGLKWALIATAFIYVGTSYMISRHGTLFFTNMLLYHPLLFFHMLFSFTMGVALKRTSLNLSWNIPGWKILSAIILIVAVKCIIDFDALYMIYTPLLVILLGNLRYPKWLKAIFLELGKKSMAIWMIHTWLAYYLFQPQVYSLKYPLFIFIGLIVASYLLAIPVMWTAGRIYDALITRHSS